MALSTITFYLLLFLIFYSTRIGSSSDNVGGAETPLNTRQPSQHTQCLINEHGPNCTYCVPSDSCEEGHFTCDMNTGNKICLPGYRGDNCQFSTDLINEYHVTCPENTCRNGGTCTSGRCCCRNGFTGILCEIEIIECKNQSCLNGGICKDLIGKFECLCKPLFHGKNCELRTDPHAWTTPSGDSSCQSHSCHNNGTCLEDTFLTYCLCPTYYTGSMCETRLGKSSASSSLCPRNYYGNQCKIYCKPQDNCFGHFVCDERTGDKICLSGWHGLNCDTRIIPQNVDPVCPKHGCKNDGQCFDKHCCCRHNYTGEYCQVESIGCLSSPCKNNATCVNQGNGFVCVCQSNFTGKFCENDIKITTEQITTTIASTFSLTTSAVAKEEKGNPTKHSMQHSFVTNVQSSQFRPKSSIYMSYSTVDISKSKSNQLLPTSESRISSAESPYFHTVSLVTTSYSSSTFEALSSMHYTDVQKPSNLPSIPASLKSRSTHFTIPTSPAKSVSIANTYPTPISLYFYPSSDFSTLHVTSSSMSPLLVSGGIHSGYFNSYANKISASVSQSVTIVASSEKSVDITNSLSVSSLTHNAAPTSSVSSYDFSGTPTGSVIDERIDHWQNGRSTASLFSQTPHYSLSHHVLPLSLSSVKQYSELLHTWSVIAPTSKNMVKSSVSTSASSSVQERNVVSSSYLQQFQYISLPESATTDPYTSVFKFIQFSSEQTTSIEPSFSESVSQFTSTNVITNSNSGYYRTNSYIPPTSASNDISKVSSEESSIDSDRLRSSSSLFTGFAVPSTYYHFPATPDIWNFYSSPPLFSITEIIHNTHAVSSGHTLKSDGQITEPTESAYIRPTKTLNKFISPLQVGNTQYHGMTTAVTGSFGTGSGEGIKTIDPIRVVDPSKARASDHGTMYTKPSFTVHARSQEILSKHFEHVTKSCDGDQSSKTIMITELDGDTENSEGLPKTWVIVLVVVACVAFLVAVIFLVVYLSVRQRRKDSRTISQSPSEIHEFSKEHFSEQPDFNNPTYDFDNDSDDDSVKYDIYVVNE